MVSSPPPVLQPRSYLAAAASLAAMTALPFALGWSAFMAAMEDKPFTEVLLAFGLPGGVVFGVLFGAAMGFFLRGIVMTVSTGEPAGFLSRLSEGVGRIGYLPHSQAPGLFVYKPSARAGMLSGRITVQLHDGQATIVGPKMHVSKLAKRL